MAVDYRRRALLCQTSVVDKLLSMLIVSLLLLASTPRVHSQIIDVRLVGSSLPNEGRVEVYYSEVWGTVCDRNFDYIDAGVVCNSLGRGYGYKGTPVGNRYGPGNGTIWMDDVHCVGAETSISLCRQRGWGKHYCDHSDDVSVSCGTSPVQHGPLSNADNFFIVADRTLRNIYQVDATSGATGQLLPLSEWTLPKVLVYDSTAKLLYWTDILARTVNRYSLLTNSTAVIYRDIRANTLYYGLAIDIGRQKLYYVGVSNSSGEVGELSTDGTAHRMLLNFTVSVRPRAVVFDENNRMLYWTAVIINYNGPTFSLSGSIYRSSVVSPAPETLVSRIRRPHALTIDFTGGVMYWSDGDTIEMAYLNGNGRKILLNRTTVNYFSYHSFIFHAGNIYFTYQHKEYIRILNVATRSVSKLLSATPFQQPEGIVFVPSTETKFSPARPTTITSNEASNTQPIPTTSGTLQLTTMKSATTTTESTLTTENIIEIASAVGGTGILTIIAGIIVGVIRRKRRKRQQPGSNSHVTPSIIINNNIDLKNLDVNRNRNIREPHYANMSSNTRAVK